MLPAIGLQFIHDSPMNGLGRNPICPVGVAFGDGRPYAIRLRRLSLLFRSLDMLRLRLRLWRIRLGRKPHLRSATLKLDAEGKHLFGGPRDDCRWSVIPSEAGEVEPVHLRQQKYHPLGGRIDARLSPPDRVKLSRPAPRLAAWRVEKPLMPRQDRHLTQPGQQCLGRAGARQGLIPRNPIRCARCVVSLSVCPGSS